MNLKKRVIEFVKRNGLMSAFGYTMRRVKHKKSMQKYANQPVQNKVLFYRGGKEYADNLRAVSMQLHQDRPDVDQVWVCLDKQAEKTLPEFVRAVTMNTDKYFCELATAKVWISSVLMPDGITKKKEQLYIQTWHGDRGFKKIVNDAMDNESYRKRKRVRKIAEVDLCDYFITGSTMAERIYRSAIGYHGKYLKCGCPRNDCLFDIDEAQCKEIRRAVGIPENVKVAIYAPTFRDNKANQGIVDSDIDLTAILNELEAKSNERWVLLKRAHGADSLQSQKAVASRILDVTKYPDMADLLMISDFLITDYSSCATDFAITGRPILIYQDDYEEYTSQNRSLYFSMAESPFWCARNMSEAKDIIRRKTKEDAKVNGKAILDFYGTYENGKATEEVSRVVTDWLSVK